MRFFSKLNEILPMHSWRCTSEKKVLWAIISKTSKTDESKSPQNNFRKVSPLCTLYMSNILRKHVHNVKIQSYLRYCFFVVAKTASVFSYIHFWYNCPCVFFNNFTLLVLSTFIKILMHESFHLKPTFWTFWQSIFSDISDVTKLVDIDRYKTD